MNTIVRKFLLGGLMSVAAVAVFAVGASAQMAAIAAIDEPAGAEGRGITASAGGRQISTKGSPKAGSGKKAAAASKKNRSVAAPRGIPSPAPPPPPPSAAAFNGPILGDKYTFLNFEVVSAEPPYYTRAAKATGAKGLVQVEVLVATDGSVLSAKARTGDKQLWPEAERAALASTFKRPTADGRPARAMGFLVYRFGPAED